MLYVFVTDLQDPAKLIAEPGGFFIAPLGKERVGDVSNVVFTNGAIADDDGKVYVYYASSDTRMHVAETSIAQLLDGAFILTIFVYFVIFSSPFQTLLPLSST